MKFLGWVVALPFMSLMLFVVLRMFLCGPDQSDVRVMKPMAEKISQYIIKNGIPESLKDIPDLPYKLEGCNKPQDNVEDCTFFVKDYRYSLELYEMGGGDLSIRIKNRATKTGVDIGLRRNNKESQWFFVEEKSFSSKRSGVCSPMKQ